MKRNTEENKLEHRNFDFGEEVWSQVSDHVRDFVQSCLQIDPTNRLSID